MKENPGLFITINVSMPKQNSLYCYNLMKFHYLLINFCLIAMGLKAHDKGRIRERLSPRSVRVPPLSYNTYCESKIIKVLKN